MGLRDFLKSPWGTRPLLLVASTGVVSGFLVLLGPYPIAVAAMTLVPLVLATYVVYVVLANMGWDARAAVTGMLAIFGLYALTVVFMSSTPPVRAAGLVLLAPSLAALGWALMQDPIVARWLARREEPPARTDEQRPRRTRSYMPPPPPSP